MQTHIDLTFGDGTYTFRLPLAQISELQRKTGTGIGALFGRVLRGRYALQDGESIGLPTEGEYSLLDLHETIRQGLIGGHYGLVNGEPVLVTPAIAQALMDAYVYPARPLREAWEQAAAILNACIEGYEEPDQKKSPVAAGKSVKRKRTPKVGSTIPAPLETSL